MSGSSWLRTLPLGTSISSALPASGATCTAPRSQHPPARARQPGQLTLRRCSPSRTSAPTTSNVRATAASSREEGDGEEVAVVDHVAEIATTMTMMHRTRADDEDSNQGVVAMVPAEEGAREGEVRLPVIVNCSASPSTTAKIATRCARRQSGTSSRVS